MKQLTPTEAREMLAGLMGDELHQFEASCSIDLASGEMSHDLAYFDKDDKLFDPLKHENLHQAFECLKAWCNSGVHRSGCIDTPISGADSNNYTLHLLAYGSSSSVPSGIDFNDEKERVVKFHPSPNYAICTVLCSALMGESVTIGDE